MVLMNVSGQTVSIWTVGRKVALSHLAVRKYSRCCLTYSDDLLSALSPPWDGLQFFGSRWDGGGAPEACIL